MLRYRSRPWAAGACALLAPFAAQADFLADSHATLDLRNYYMNRDFRQPGAAQNHANEWAQGAWLKLESGYSAGTVGFGLDALGELGLRLDSSTANHGTGLLPYDHSGQPAQDYSELGLTAKAKVANTTLKLGTLQPTLPVASINDTRLMPSTYQGALLNSQDIAGLTLNLGRLTRQNLRDSSGNDAMSYEGVRSGHLDLAGGTWSVTPTLKASYYYAQLQDIYSQHYLGLLHDLPLADGVKLRSDLRAFTTQGSGAEKLRGSAAVDGGRIDNRFFNGMLSLSVGFQRVGLGYQNLSGKGDFAYPGLDPYSVNLVTINVFTKADTDAWQARYDYDFAGWGLPGLSFMTRYVDGRDVRTARVSGARERERDTDLAYVVQSGSLRGLSIRLRNASLRSGGGLTTAIDEARVILGYTLALW